MTNLFAEHEAEYIAKKVNRSERVTYQLHVGTQTYAFSKIRMGCTVPEDRPNSYYFCSPPQRVYSSSADGYKSHNWEL